MKSHPNSLANLIPNAGTNKPRYSEAKKRRHITVTETNWVAAKQKVKQEFGLSISELIEKIGIGEYELVKKLD